MLIPLSKFDEKDNFHNLILCVDKMVAFGIVYSTILSKFYLSEGGGGWRKTFKFSSKTTTSFRKSGNFPGAQMREAYKDAPLLVGVSDNVLQKGSPIFIKVVKYEVELIICEPFLPKKYLTVVKIQNFGQQMITGTDLKKRLFLVKCSYR